MEYAVLAVQTDDLNRIVEALRREIEPKLNPSPSAYLLIGNLTMEELGYSYFEERSAGDLMTRTGYYTGTALFVEILLTGRICLNDFTYTRNVLPANMILPSPIY